MASSFPTSSVGLQTLALLREQILSQALLDGQSLDDFIISSLTDNTPRSSREISASALTGRIRADAGMLSQASRNVSEAQSIAEIAQGALKSIGKALGEMQELASAVAAGEMSGADAATAYQNLAGSVEGIISSTSYNGINLLDGGKWAADERLSLSGDGAALSIQAGLEAMRFSLKDLGFMKGSFAASDLDAVNIYATASRLSELSGTVETMRGSYEGLAALYGSEANSLNHQAGVLSRTAARAEGNAAAGARLDIQSLLLDFILSQSGRLVDESS